jgi:hypothetical protein
MIADRSEGVRGGVGGAPIDNLSAACLFKLGKICLSGKVNYLQGCIFIYKTHPKRLFIY